MRLIDADRLLDIMRQERDRISDTYGENDEYVRCLNTYAISMVLNAPTIEECKTGHWIPMEVSSGRDSWKCSVCGRRARGKIENLPYCHCGADMREKTDGHN